MSGYNPGRRGGRGGRGYRNNNSNNGRGNCNNNKDFKATNKKKILEEYYFYVGSAKQASNYKSAANFTINHIKKDYERGRDIAESLRELKKPNTDTWMPKLKGSTKKDDAAKETENRQFKMEYKAMLSEALHRIRIYDDNLVKSYALIWERCNTAMQSRLEQRTDYESTIYNGPVELLQAIKEHALDYQETRYKMSIISDAFRALFGTKQREGENLQEYTRQFMTSKEILESYIGAPLILQKFVESRPSYDSTNDAIIQTLVQQASEQFMAFIYLENSDRKKYGSVLNNLNSQKSLGNDQYPKTPIESNNVLGSHRFDEHKNTGQSQKDKDNSPKEPNQENDTITPLSFAQMEGKCYCCGKPGHKSPACRHKSKPKDEWAINKAEINQQQQHAQTNKKIEEIDVVTKKLEPEASITSNADDTSVNTVGWDGAHYQMLQSLNMRDEILLNTASSTSLFGNKDYIAGIKESDGKLELHTNGGPIY
jgi:hypothetical protein